MSSVADHFDTDFFTMCARKIGRQLADPFIALYNFYGVFVHGVVELSFCNKFFSDLLGFYTSLNMISTRLTWCETKQAPKFPCCLLPRLPSDDCVVTKNMFCVILQCRFASNFSLESLFEGYLQCSYTRYFRLNSIFFISTVGFSYEDNCC